MLSASRDKTGTNNDARTRSGDGRGVSPRFRHVRVTPRPESRKGGGAATTYSKKHNRAKMLLLHTYWYVFVFFFHPVYGLRALLFSLRPIHCRNSDLGSHNRHFFPLPTTFRALHCLAFLSREDFSSFFPRRLASICAVGS